MPRQHFRLLGMRPRTWPKGVAPKGVTTTGKAEAELCPNGAAGA